MRDYIIMSKDTEVAQYSGGKLTVICEKLGALLGTDISGNYIVTNYPVQFLNWSYKKSWYMTLIDCPFEDMTVKIPRDYDALLKVEYGEYLKLPPEDKRHPEHKDDLFKIF